MSILLILILFQFNNFDLNDKDEIIKQIEENRINTSCSVDIIINYKEYDTEKIELTFYKIEENKLPFLHILDLKDSSIKIINESSFEYKNDTLFLDTNKHYLYEGYYKSFYCLLFKDSKNQLNDLRFHDYSLILNKYFNINLNDEKNNFIKDLKTELIYKDNIIKANISFNVKKENPYFINAYLETKYSFDKNYNLKSYIDKQVFIEKNNDTSSNLYTEIIFSNYDFITPDTSLFNTDRPYKVLVNVDSVRKAKQTIYDKIKKSQIKLPDKFNLVNNEIVDITKQKDIKVYNFWGSWCGFCYLSYPSIQKISDEFGNKVEVIGWGAMERDTSRIMPYIKKKKINFPYILGADTLAIKLEVKSFQPP